MVFGNSSGQPATRRLLILHKPRFVARKDGALTISGYCGSIGECRHVEASPPLSRV
jgi:hypothetical protein